MVRKTKNQLKWQKRCREKQKELNNENDELEIVNSAISEGSKAFQMTEQANTTKFDQQYSKIMMNSEMKDEFNEGQQNNNPLQQQCMNLKEDKKEWLKNQLLSLIKNIENQEIYCREQEKTQVSKFLYSEQSEQIMYVCGTTGSGKTITIMSTLIANGIKFQTLNCITTTDIEKHIYHYSKTNNQQIPIDVLLLDQCDKLINLNIVIKSFQLNRPQTKIILICNQNCQNKISTECKLRIVYFIPYTKQEITLILKSKLKNLSDVVSHSIINEAVLIACKKGGDFREAQKFILRWAHNKMNEINSTKNDKKIDQFSKSGNQFFDLVQLFMNQNVYKQNRLIRNVLDLCEEEKSQQLKEIRKHRKCRCIQKNNIETVIRIMKHEMPRTECLLTLKKWQQLGVIQFGKRQCKMHEKKVLLLKFNIDIPILRNMITSYFYYSQ